MEKQSGPRRTGHRGDRAAFLLSTALFKVGDVVVTEKSVPCLIKGSDKRDGYADKGWKWRITEVRLEQTGGGLILKYDCVAHDAPGMYWQSFREKQVSHKLKE